MNLTLTRPIVFFDLETTGVNVATDRIVEYSFLKIHPDGTKETKTSKINPQMPIPIESSKIHGIYDKDIENAPTFKQVAFDITEFIKNCDLAGYNSNKFDLPVLMEEFLRSEVEFDLADCKFVDVQNIFHKMEQRTLVAAYKFYCEKELENAHSAEADILATYEVLEKQLEKYPSLGSDIDTLHSFSKMNNNVDFAGRIVLNDRKEEIFNFGKHKGKRVKDVFKQEPSYYNWMMQGEFPLYTKKVISKLKEQTQ